MWRHIPWGQPCATDGEFRACAQQGERLDRAAPRRRAERFPQAWYGGSSAVGRPIEP
ncbi:hypothetical protein DFJ69_3265 [Thermomonospora umbrina]|uniref:Uncharacterized protein n=1 Tax=Thermomonospora umbrina TaxID=111806 RepID=A0A3D9STH9_9ACTN|nr:hypothetical protein DFJ69_3265 [Thermomonospora umbrina]